MRVFARVHVYKEIGRNWYEVGPGRERSGPFFIVLQTRGKRLENRSAEVTVPAFGPRLQRPELPEPATRGCAQIRSLRSRAPPRWLASRCARRTPHDHRSMPSRRTVRKPTVWTLEEWRHIEAAAAACGVRPLRYVRQAAVVAELPPCSRRRGARALLREFAGVLDTLHQFLRLAHAAGDPSIAVALESTIRITSKAAEAAAARRGSAEPLIIAVREAGRVLHALAHQARDADALPADEELGAALVSIQIAALGAVRVTHDGHGAAVCSIPSRRTIRKTTVWTPDEWRHIEEAARARGVPPLRYVREAALAAKLPPHTRRRRVHALVREVKRVLNNLHQLLHLAEDDGAPAVAAAVESTIRIAQDAARAAAARHGCGESLIVAVREAGVVLNELTHQAHVAKELPADEELGAALARIQFAAIDVAR